MILGIKIQNLAHWKKKNHYHGLILILFLTNKIENNYYICRNIHLKFITMKKTMLQLFFALMLATGANAQAYHPFPVSNAIWHQSFGTGENSLDTSYYFSYGLIGDTVINTMQYSKVYRFQDSLPDANAEYFGCLREDSSKRVFYIGWDFWKMHYQSQEIQLYDFSKALGDSISYGIWGKKPITMADSILIDAQYRKRFVVLWDTIVEGIGCLNNLLSPITDIPTKMATKWDLVCFRQNEEVLYLNPDYPTCFPSADGIADSDQATNDDIRIYPQPLLSISYIDFSEAKTPFHSLTIYNMFGQLVYHTDIKDNERIPLSRADFSPGLHLYKLENANGRSVSGKIMIE